MTVDVRAPAKINRSLQLVGVRPDGYHELRTVFQSLALHDTITVRPARGPFTLTCDDPQCPVDESNLVWQAAERTWRAAGRRGSVRDLSVQLVKRIPMQAGLGGGSSDAAATIRAIGRLLKLDPRCFHEIAASLGADVPYFLEGGTALGLERGDVLYPLVDAPPAWVVLVVPDFGVSTRDAYAWWDQQSDAGRATPTFLTSAGPHPRGRRPRAAALGRIKNRTSPSLLEHTGNDLQQPVVAHHPEIGQIIKSLERAGGRQAAQVAMSGSGSAVFGLFDNKATAEQAARAARAASTARRQWRVWLTRTVDRVTYQQLVRISRHRLHLRFAPRRLGRS
jgi:4-diphosphocytidyl-2-C-methyl-D-erythritol kinase